MISWYEGYPLNTLQARVMITKEKERKTYADYAALGEGAPYQLINGELVMTPAPTFFHQRVVWHLGTDLFTFVEHHDLGIVVGSPVVVWHLGTDLFTFVEHHDLGIVVGSPVVVYFSETETYQPDLIFISEDRLDIIAEQQVTRPHRRSPVSGNRLL